MCKNTAKIDNAIDRIRYHAERLLHNANLLGISMCLDEEQ